MWSVDARSSLTFFEESYRIRAEMGDLSRMALSLSNLASTLFDLGEVSRARESATQALELAREIGDRRHIALALDNLGWNALSDDRFGEARALFKEALFYAQQIGNANSVRYMLYGLAAVAGASGDGRLAARLAAAAEPKVRGTFVFDRWLQAEIEQKLAAARAQTDPREWDEAWAAGAALTIEQATAEVLET